MRRLVLATSVLVASGAFSAAAAAQPERVNVATERNRATIDLRIRVQTWDGVFLVLEPPPAPMPAKRASARLAFWRHREDDLIHAYDRLLFTPADLGDALAGLERDLGIDLHSIVLADIALEQALAASTSSPREGFWQPATPTLLTDIIGYPRTDEIASAPLLAAASGAVTGGDGPHIGALCRPPIVYVGGSEIPPPAAGMSPGELFLLIEELADYDTVAAAGCCPGGRPCHGVCCFMDGCCSILDQACCRGRCCRGYCCRGQFCCDNGDVCCQSGCCPGNSTCCGWTCCPAGRECCNGRCCPVNTVCCGGRCCPVGHKCCQPSKCCPEDGTCCDGLCCHDGNPCTEDVCENGVCVYPPIPCPDDGNPCTDDYCVGGECTHPPNYLGCDDGDGCTLYDQCSGSYCSGTPDPGCAWPSCPGQFVVDGEGQGQGVVYIRSSRMVIPQGTACVGLRVYYFSTEYPEYTGNQSEYNDRVSFLVSYPNGVAAQGSISVNSLHGHFGPGPYPGGNFLVVEQELDFSVLTAEGPSWMEFRGSATNVSDGRLGSGVAIEIECSALTAEIINQDNPASTTWLPLDQGAPIYGGSERSTADNVRLRISLSAGTVSNIVWSVEGPGGGTFNPPPTGSQATEWDLGDILNPTPGQITFKVDVSYTDGSHQCGAFRTEIGVRTDDVILIGWIDPNNVPLSTAGVSTVLTTDFPPSGPPAVVAPLCGACEIMADVAHGKTVTCGVDFATSNANRTYLLHWLFKYAGNVDPAITIPGSQFRNNADTQIDENKIVNFVSTATNYKLFNRFQVKFRANSTGFLFPTATLKAWAFIGSTINPLAGCPLATSPAPGQAGPNNAKVQWTTQSAWRVNEGSPEAVAILAFNTLMGNAVASDPHFWESIGSRIRFRFDNGTEPIVTVQVYPTYSEYHNGRFVRRDPQEPDPQANFRVYPYPFGAVPCTGIPVPHAQGRCGDAVSPEDVTARIPPFLP